MATRGTPLPMDLRNAISRFLLNGQSQRCTARAVGVSRETVRKYRVHRITRRRADDSDGGLAEIVQAWPHLPEAIRSRLLAIVRA